MSQTFHRPFPNCSKGIATSRMARVTLIGVARKRGLQQGSEGTFSADKRRKVNESSHIGITYKTCDICNGTLNQDDTTRCAECGDRFCRDCTASAELKPWKNRWEHCIDCQPWWKKDKPASDFCHICGRTRKDSNHCVRCGKRECWDCHYAECSLCNEAECEDCDKTVFCEKCQQVVCPECCYTNTNICMKCEHHTGESEDELLESEDVDVDAESQSNKEQTQEERQKYVEQEVQFAVDYFRNLPDDEWEIEPESTSKQEQSKNKRPMRFEKCNFRYENCTFHIHGDCTFIFN